MSAVEMARAAKQARLERLAPPPIIGQPDEQEQVEHQWPEPEPMLEEGDGHVDGCSQRTDGTYDEVIELDDTEPSPAGGVICPWEIVTPPAPSSFPEQQGNASEKQTQQGTPKGVLPRWTGQGALPLPQSQQQLDTALAESLQRQLVLDYAEEVRLKELGALRNLAANPRAAATAQPTVPTQANAQRYRNLDYDEAFDVEDDELDGYDDRPWMTSNRVCEAH